MNTHSNIRKAPRQEKHLKRSIHIEMEIGQTDQKYLDEQARLDHEEEMACAMILEEIEEQRRIKEDEEYRMHFFDDDYDDFFNFGYDNMSD